MRAIDRAHASSPARRSISKRFASVWSQRTVPAPSLAPWESESPKQRTGYLKIGCQEAAAGGGLDSWRRCGNRAKRSPRSGGHRPATYLGCFPACWGSGGDRNWARGSATGETGGSALEERTDSLGGVFALHHRHEVGKHLFHGGVVICGLKGSGRLEHALHAQRGAGGDLLGVEPSRAQAAGRARRRLAPCPSAGLLRRSSAPVRRTRCALPQPISRGKRSVRRRRGRCRAALPASGTGCHEPRPGSRSSAALPRPT